MRHSSIDASMTGGADLFGRHAVKALATGDSATIAEMMPPAERTSEAFQSIGRQFKLMRTADTNTIELVGMTITESPQGVLEELGFQLHTTTSPILVRTLAV